MTGLNRTPSGYHLYSFKSVKTSTNEEYDNFSIPSSCDYFDQVSEDTKTTF